MAEVGAIDRRKLALLLGPVAVFVALSYLGTALAPTLLTHHPLWLLAIDSRNRHLVLVAGKGVDVEWFFLIGFLRLVASDPLFYLLGREYGEVALRWAEDNLGSSGRYVAFVRRHFPKFSHVLVALMPNNLICTMAGATRMSPPVFLVLNVGGTVVRLALVWSIGDALSEPLDPLFDFISRYQWQLLAASIGLVMLQVALDQRKGRSDIASLDTLESEFEQARAEVERGADGTPPDQDTGEDR